MLEQEHFFTCPYCGETISMFLDVSVRKQQYIEDCEVCCNPIQINYEFENEIIISFSARSIEQ
ncbi:CPXCG motif-containing cysteine-rich protein [Fulvivirga maritima]|uniref:CPXCG motif-containing cysteine-rich protein n=1 Tax=Fulvivirga maritima TaxID=2904247 RepID=UPI001F324B42|nr:CPXCG motif-containing cysteine-rich protein [Fulvivirga maritima]UII28268.1 CPXCG motif-containing cysteine-rich protein [Fulvivirga maritima]